MTLSGISSTLFNEVFEGVKKHQKSEQCIIAKVDDDEFLLVAGHAENNGKVILSFDEDEGAPHPIAALYQDGVHIFEPEGDRGLSTETCDKIFHSAAFQINVIGATEP